MGWGRGRTDPPTAASPIAICNDRYTSIRDIQSVATNVRFGEGFRTPAICRTVVGVLGPAFESLPRRKPRVGRDAVWSGAAYGDFRSRTGRVCRRGGWRRAILAAGPTTAGVFGREYARAWRGRGGRRRTGDLVRTSAC